MGQLILPIARDADIENQSYILESIIGGNVATFVTESRLFELVGTLVYLFVLVVLVAKTSKPNAQVATKEYRYVGLLVSIGLLCLSIYLAAVFRESVGGNIVEAITDTILDQAPRHHNSWSTLFAKIGQSRLELPYHTTMASTVDKLFYVTLPIAVALTWLTRLRVAKLVQSVLSLVKRAIHAVHRRV